MKWIRDYIILIQTPDGDTLEVKPPFSAHFDVTRNTLASTNSCSLTLNNLSRSIRNRIFKDRYSITEYWQIVILAGYKKLETVFQGNILQSQSHKSGVDWITQIEAFDGLYGVQNGVVAQTVSAGTSFGEVFGNVINTMPNMLSGLFGGKANETTGERGQVLLGQSSGVLGDLTDGNYFIDNETVNILNQDEVIATQVLLLDEKQLFTSPKRQDTNLDVEILFLPQVRVGFMVEIRSVEEIYNGQYKAIGFKHSVDVLSSSSGSAKTTLTLYAGAQGLQEVG